MDGLADVGLRGGGFGRLAWTADGEECYLQYLPPTLVNLSAPPELMVAQMDYVGVDRAVLQTGHLYGRLNGYLADAVRRFPDRFWGLAMIDEWRADSPSQLRTLERAIETLGLQGLLVPDERAGAARAGRDGGRPGLPALLGPRARHGYTRLPERDRRRAGPRAVPGAACVAGTLARQVHGHPRRLPPRPVPLPVHAGRRDRDTGGGVAGAGGPEPGGRDTDTDIPGRDLGVPVRRGRGPSSASTTSGWGRTGWPGAPTCPTWSATAPTGSPSTTCASTATSSQPGDMAKICGGNIAQVFGGQLTAPGRYNLTVGQDREPTHCWTQAGYDR